MSSTSTGPHQPVLAAAVPLLPRRATILTPSVGVADALRAAGLAVQCSSVAAYQGAAPAAVALLDDEVSLAGDHAEGLIAAAVDLVEPGGVLAVSAASAVALTMRRDAGDIRGFRADELVRALGHRGVAVTLTCAPGAAAGLHGHAEIYDAELDRLPGLLDAGPRVLVVGRTPRSMSDRSAQFFATLPYKVVAAAVLCRDHEGRLLVVHDTFKGHWTIPGGVVDADEDPKAAAEREAWEEAGIRVQAGPVLGVFSASWPDRVVLVYGAQPVTATAGGQPIHAHEIDAVDWWPVSDALGRLAPHVAEQVRHCLDHPGGTLRQGLA